MANVHSADDDEIEKLIQDEVLEMKPRNDLNNDDGDVVGDCSPAETTIDEFSLQIKAVNQKKSS